MMVNKWPKHIHTLVVVVAENKYTFYERMIARVLYTITSRAMTLFHWLLCMCFSWAAEIIKRKRCFCLLYISWGIDQHRLRWGASQQQPLAQERDAWRKKPPIIIRFRFSRCRRSKQEEKITERDYSGIFKEVFCCYSLGASRSSSLSVVCVV